MDGAGAVQVMTNASIVLGSAVLFATLVMSRRRSRLWLLDPRGFLAVIVFLNACALPLYYALSGHYPAVFGLDEKRIDEATILLVSGQMGLLCGTAIPTRTASRLLPRLGRGIGTGRAFLLVLVASVLATGLFQYLRLLSHGLASVIGAQYGATQWDDAEGGIPAIYNLGRLCAPSLNVLIVVWAQLGRRLRSCKLLAITAYALLPALIAGGRRDVIFAVLATMLAWALRAGRTRARQFAVLALLVVGIGYVLGVARSGKSLEWADRVAAVRSNASTHEHTVAARTVTMVSGTAVMTAALDTYGGSDNYGLGRTYWESVVNVLLPKAVMGYYPYTPPGLAFRELFYAEVDGYGMDYSLAAEAYQNFGVPGPFMVFCVMGWLLAVSFRKACERGGVWLLLHMQCTTSALWAIRCDSNTSFKLLVYGCASTLAVYGIARGLSARHEDPGNECRVYRVRKLLT